MEAANSFLHCETLPYDLSGALHFAERVFKIWTYGITLWGRDSNSNIEILQRSQNKVLRALANAPWYICYCKSPKIGKSQVLPVNPSIYRSEVVKVRKMLVQASISGFYQTIVVNVGIYQHQLVKARFV
jgi:hypothetical protein